MLNVKKSKIAIKTSNVYFWNSDSIVKGSESLIGGKRDSKYKSCPYFFVTRGLFCQPKFLSCQAGSNRNRDLAEMEIAKAIFKVCKILVLRFMEMKMRFGSRGLRSSRETTFVRDKDSKISVFSSTVCRILGGDITKTSQF